MNKIRKTIIFGIILMVTLVFSCQDQMQELNENPNGPSPNEVHPNFLMSTIVTSTARTVTGLGFGDLAGVVQHTQKDGWSGGHNSYDWSDQSWSGYYGILRNADEFYKKSKEMELEFHQGVGLVMKAYVFGMIADLWGDAPFSNSLKGELEGEENLRPVFDSQRDIYVGILGYLEEANTLLSKSKGEYLGIDPVQDVLYKGDPVKWRKFANSLALRYYMRISEKEPQISREGIERIAGDPDKYPLILNAWEDANIDYIGNTVSDSWPGNTVFDGTGGSDYRRIKLCSTLVETLQALDDPRLGLWANKIDIPIVVDPTLADDTDEIIDGVRYVAMNIEDQYIASYGIPIDQDPEYVGMPPAWSIVPQAYNLNPNLEQAPHNPHCSHLNDRYKNAAGPLLKARMLSAAEVHFILAEAALKGWATGSAQEHYEAGVKASFDTWGVSGEYADYIAGGAAFDGTLEQVMGQKWIASWTAASEAWFDYRRTGLPAFQAGPFSKRSVLPLRFYYMKKEIEINTDNANAAIDKLEETQYTAPDTKNSAWSRPWLMQGTGKPW